ncbi:MAG: 4-hydroxy-tetrahydrodipicolinate synthase [Candidatus Levybacteria bacterium RIFCSPHIGHO2_12_FULL_38_12]|nr:MAG: 4-hydroxy-tetrahydrodipicolinate synthase [Candidatus Levybacteria bacterium RIFCSPHIGHO2_12_FULL_38_12]OGH34031.1 MAG: 4-hydroxy-tetrahydrodipicolinate synthase [Candidatus Levybacteria bacterium RIFCSPLOWO2_01_FULL_37_20]OGH44890.1 MAG: 4-hydroxy-tetrahydrodipicolinate synthase [Candidatus Levybacteria bacterium RIFCSPLOWO2_02_FULL_37_18]OGH51345.1 MAG: 4-hydroxy-tetrahydrodipicolinate synthase [Candidatus Levybacteria bacterium RIFCSPLOWO2_12_FULL_37_7]
MKKFKKLAGAITALVTPFQKNGKVDVKTLKKLVDFQIESRIDGLVPCGSTGEAATLTLEEHELVVRTVVEQTKGRVPVIAGAGSNDTHKAIVLSKLCKKAGANALLHVTPYYNKPTPDGLVAHYKAVANAVNLPIILYNVPGRTGANIPASVTLRVAKEVPHVVGVKEASGNIDQMTDIIKGSSADFSVLSGDDSFTYPLIALGGDGCISVVSNEVPKEFSDLIRAALSKDFETAKTLHFKLLDLMRVNFIETNPLPVKTALSLMGKIEEVFRLPLVPMTAKNKEALKEVLKKQKLM